MKSKQSFIKICDRFWSEIILRRAGHKCEFCGGLDQITPHHIVGRANMTLRWDLENGIALCFFHHRMAHDNPNQFKEQLAHHKGERLLPHLTEMAWVITKRTLSDWEWMENNLKHILKDLRGEAI